MTTMDVTDREILDIIQQDFPISATPFGDIARKLCIDEDEVIERVKRLKDEGVIRRIGGVLDSKSMNFVSCLCAMSVPKNRVAAIASEISECPGVTHNYERDDDYNLWFTLTCASEEEKGERILEWERKFGMPVLCFPAEKTFKRRVRFMMGGPRG